jgi:hypothetical protein
LDERPVHDSAPPQDNADEIALFPSRIQSLPVCRDIGKFAVRQSSDVEGKLYPVLRIDGGRLQTSFRAMNEQVVSKEVRRQPKIQPCDFHGVPAFSSIGAIILVTTWVIIMTCILMAYAYTAVDISSGAATWYFNSDSYCFL